MQESMVVRKVILADQIPNIDMCRDFHCHRTTADQSEQSGCYFPKPLPWTITAKMETREWPMNAIQVGWNSLAVW